MNIQRIVPNLTIDDPGLGHDFYIDVLGLEPALDLGWITTFRSPDQPRAQISLVSRDATAARDSVVSVCLSDVDATYARAQRLGYEIVHPLTDEPWGVRRFFVRDPYGHVINVLRHLD